MWCLGALQANSRLLTEFARMSIGATLETNSRSGIVGANGDAESAKVDEFRQESTLE